MADDSSPTKVIGIMVALIVILIVLISLSVFAYHREGEKASAVISDEGEKDPNHLEVFVKTISADPIKGDMVVRLEFSPHGDLTDDGGSTVNRDLKLYVNSANGKQEHDFPKGKRMNPMDVTLEMYEGEVSDYPFDKHRAQLELDINAPPSKDKKPEKKEPEKKPENSSGASEPATASEEEGKKEQPAASPSPAPASGEEDVAIAVDFFGSLHGMKVEATKSPDSTADYVGIDITLTRATTTIFFSSFIMVAMWTLTLSVLFLTIYVATYRRKIELAMFSFLAALLFAFPALRNGQPSTPPVGTLGDFLAFFWCEVIIALCLLTILSLWLLRPPAK